MNTFILWIHVLIASPLGTTELHSVNVAPVQYDTLEICEAAGEQRIANLRDDLENQNYILMYDCEAHSPHQRELAHYL